MNLIEFQCLLDGCDKAGATSKFSIKSHMNQMHACIAVIWCALLAANTKTILVKFK